MKNYNYTMKGKSGDGMSSRGNIINSKGGATVFPFDDLKLSEEQSITIKLNEGEVNEMIELMDNSTQINETLARVYGYLHSDADGLDIEKRSILKIDEYEISEVLTLISFLEANEFYCDSSIGIQRCRVTGEGALQVFSEVEFKGEWIDCALCRPWLETKFRLVR